MEKTKMVGEEGVIDSSENNGLQEGAGENDALIAKEDFEHRPHRDRSRFGLTGLRSLRDKYGPLSAAGHRVSNIEELFDNLPPGPEDRIEYLTSDATKEQYEAMIKLIRKQAADLAGLLAAGG